MAGKLFGVGVGPGDPELLTLKALKALREATVIAYPAPPSGRSYALDIVSPHIADTTKELLPLRFAMTKDPAIKESMLDAALGEITARLDRGLNVAFVTEGDPFLYSTFIHLYRRLKEKRGDIEIAIIPGVSSLTAVGTSLGVPIADRDDSIAVVPATYGTEKIRTMLETFDTVILVKVASRLREVRELLEEKGLVARAFLAEKVTSKEERILKYLPKADGKEFHYLTTVVVTPNRAPGPEPPLLLLIHGSPMKTVAVELAGIIESLREALPGVEVLPCHLEHTPPDLTTAIENVKKVGYDRAVVVPYFLFKARHLKVEVPEVLRGLDLGSLRVTLTDPLWPSDTLLSMLEEKARMALEGVGDNTGARLMLVGRGTSDPSIPPILSTLASTLTERLRVDCAVGYSDLTEPSLEEAVCKMRESSAGPIVALPLYLSHGFLVEEMTKRMERVMDGHRIPFVTAEPVGPDPRLVSILLQRYREALRA